MSYAQQLSFDTALPGRFAWPVRPKPAVVTTAQELQNIWSQTDEITCDPITRRVTICKSDRTCLRLSSAIDKIMTKQGAILVSGTRVESVCTTDDPALLIEEDGSCHLMEHYTSTESASTKPVKVLAFVFHDGSTFTVPA